MIELSLVSIAAEHIDRLPTLRPDVPARDESIISSLTQFDVLAIFAAIAGTQSLSTKSWYTNFARYDWPRSAPALVAFIEDPAMRSELAPLEDAGLADAIREVSRSAEGESYRFAVWQDWHSDVIQSFLDQHPPAGGQGTSHPIGREGFP